MKYRILPDSANYYEEDDVVVNDATKHEEVDNAPIITAKDNDNRYLDDTVGHRQHISTDGHSMNQVGTAYDVKIVGKVDTHTAVTTTTNYSNGPHRSKLEP